MDHTGVGWVMHFCVVPKIPVFSLSGKTGNQIPCAMATLIMQNMAIFDLLQAALFNNINRNF